MTIDEFRTEVRQFLDRELEQLRQDFPGVADSDMALRRAFEDRISSGGYAGLGWPKADGGRELPVVLIAVFLEELARAGAPKGVNLIGHGILAPTLLLHGSDEQRRQHLPGILANTSIWCQGYSEPASGSDLASLRTRAELKDGDYVVNGQKIWTSYAHIADWCFLLVRTDPAAARHKGISFLLVDMKTPGITVRPIRQMDGQKEFAEVYFDDVRVPVANRVGAENEGWRIAMAAASFERATYFIPRIVQMEEELFDLAKVAKGLTRRGRPVSEQPAIREGFARAFVDVKALRLHARSMLEAASRNEQPGPEGSFIKLLWSESHQRLLDLALDVLGRETALGPGEATARRKRHWQKDQLWSRAETILAGTSEIQRNIIGEHVLGLPR